MEKSITVINKHTSIQFLKFTIFSISAGIVQVISFTIFNELVGFQYWPSYLFALILSVIHNFTLNRKFTFKSASNVSLAMMKVAGYYIVFTPLSTWWGDRLTDLGWNDYLVLFGTMIINFVTEFLFTKFVVFRDVLNKEA